MSELRHSSNQPPKWLLYGLAIKLAAVVLIVVAVLWFAGIF